MKKLFKAGRWICLCAGLLASAFAADPPQAEISNSAIRARFYLPDPESGYYRATRFDWSGVISSLEYKGHSYFGQWFEKYDPKIHDAIMGPVEEFTTDDAGFGYNDAKAGGSFLRIGVGAVRKPAQEPSSRFVTYDIADPGLWTVQRGPDWISFTQQVPATDGYAYLYRKTVRLTKGKPEMVLEHSLKNTGQRTIETNVYDHNFFVIDEQASGPDFVVRFPFDAKAGGDVKDILEVRDRQVTYRRKLEKNETVLTPITGFTGSAADYNIAVENRKTGAGVRVTGDQPLTRVVFWSAPKVLSPEAYITLKIEPGQERAWRMAYEFYTLPAAGKTAP
jgi:hypothetical protein